MNTKTLHISVVDCVATYQKRDGDIVCGNKTKYEIQFSFDAEWDAHATKTARFIWNNEYFDVEFTGDTCAVPVITGTSECSVGVYAGDLKTTTSAEIKCRPSILCGRETPNAGTGQSYSSEAKASADRAKNEADRAGSEADRAKNEADRAEDAATQAAEQAAVQAAELAMAQAQDAINTAIDEAIVTLLNSEVYKWAACYRRDRNEFELATLSSGTYVIKLKFSFGDIIALNPLTYDHDVHNQAFEVDYKLNEVDVHHIRVVHTYREDPLGSLPTADYVRIYVTGPDAAQALYIAKIA